MKTKKYRPAGSLPMPSQLVRQLVETLWAELTPTHAIGRGFDETVACDKISLFVSEQINALPRYLFWPMVVLHWLFAASALAQTGSRFDSMPLQRRIRILQSWRSGWLGSARDFIYFYDNLVIFASFALAEETCA